VYIDTRRRPAGLIEGTLIDQAWTEFAAHRSAPP
jgi:hypothetical protein